MILDGWVRDRCPYVGDIYVVDNTLDVSHPSLDVQRSMLAWFAQAQHISGAIPASPIFNGSLVLFDYNAYWIQSLYEYTLHSGNVAFVREVWPNLDRLMGWYAARTRPDGLLVNNLGPRDYGYVHRRGSVVAYYNAQYALALREAIRLAVWAGETQNVVGWLNRANSVARAFTPSFWDATAGAFADTTTDFGTHPQDANAFAILAGLATPQKAASALSYLALHNSRFYGNTYTDSNTWTPTIQGASQWVYPFMSYEEVLARFETGSDSTALDLIRREWGYMLTHGPKSTMWETIGALGTGPINPAVPSWDHGWSSGAAPALTEYVLGVEPTSPGFTTFTVDPHPGDLKWASGTVPTPHGPILVSWRRKRETIALHVTAPPGTVWLRGVPSTP